MTNASTTEASRPSRPKSQSHGHVDIAVIGCGPGGLYTAWRLLQDPKYRSQTIALFDAADRIGGRILTVRLPEVPYEAEVGGMRYLPEQILVSSLIEKKLALQTSEFNLTTNGYFLRGKYISQDDLKAKNDLYRVHESEQGKIPVELITLAILRALKSLQIPDAAAQQPESQGISIVSLRKKLQELSEKDPPKKLILYFSTKEWRLIKRYGEVKGRPLFQLGFWDLVQLYLSQEGYNLAQDGGGYQSILSMWNAADAIVWYLADFGGSPYKTIVSGMGTLTRRLAEEIAKLAPAPSAGGPDVFNLAWALKKIEGGRSGRPFRLTFDYGEILRSTERIVSRTVTATKVVLALPQPALKALQITNLRVPAQGPDSDEQAAFLFGGLLDGVTANPLFKAFVMYEQPWLREEAKPSCFRIFTDLPLRQIYQFGTDRQNPAIPTNRDRTASCALMAYSDGRYADYWNVMDRVTVRDQRYFLADFEDSLSKREKTEFRHLLQVYGTSDFVMSRIRAQLDIVAGERAAKQEPATVIRKHWSDFPYWGGWHSWNMGYQSWVVAAHLVRPFEAELYTCGEAFSSEQGWIEGALKSAERMLERMNVAPPAWVDPAEYERQKELWL